MADEENIPENDLFPPETKSRGLTRTGNFRKNVRKKYSAQQSDPGSTRRELSLSAEERNAPIMKSRTMPNMPRYGSQNSLSSGNNSDSSYVSLDNSPDSDRRDKTSETTFGIGEPTSTFSSLAQTTISDLNKRTENLENISKREKLKACDETSQTNKLSTESRERSVQKANGHVSEELTHESGSHEPFNKENISNNETTNRNDANISLDDSLQAIGSAATSLGVDLARGVGFVGKAAADAWDFFSSTLDHLKSANSENGSDDSWHDAGSDLSDEDKVDYFDANEDQRPRDRIHFICNELLTTEESYVERLKILVEVKKKTTKLLGSDTARQMFHDIETICTFHSDYLLPTLSDRLKKWGQYQKIGDVMKKLTPFLKLYTEYVKDMHRSSSLVNSYEEKSSAFATILKDAKEKQPARCSNQPIQAHMMEPVQRVPRYELLLRDYLKHSPEGAADREDAEEALQSVSKAAKHFEEMIKRDSTISQLLEIQSRLDGAHIVSPHRELVKRGRLQKVSDKGTLSERYMFLFNDMLLVCSKVKLSVIARFKVKREFNLKDVWVIEGTNLEYANTLCLRSWDCCVELMASSEEEQKSWVQALQETREKYTGNCDEKNVHKEQAKDSRVLQSGQMSISCDEGRVWKKKHLSIHSNGWMYVHRTSVDNETFTGINLHHFTKKLVDPPCSKRSHTLQLSSSDNPYNKKGQAIQLAAVGRKYYFHLEDQDELNSWMTGMNSTEDVKKRISSKINILASKQDANFDSD